MRGRKRAAEMRNGFRIYDTHTHVGRARHSLRAYSADELLRAMDRFGVERSLVLPFPSVDDEREAHDVVGRAVRAHPDRLAGACSVGPFSSEAALREEVGRAVAQYGFTAIKLQPQYQPLNPLHRHFEFYFETVREHRLTLVVHTGDGVPLALPSLWIVPARRYPDLRIVLAHSGGPLFHMEAIVAAQVCENICLELSSLAPHHVANILRHVPPSRLLIGSDLPESLSTEIGKVLELAIPDSDKDEILWRNPCRLFGGGA
jgi:predicted TIM-barrel fold metal-dependent hydrolase